MTRNDNATAGMAPLLNETKLLVDRCQAGLKRCEDLVRANYAPGHCIFATATLLERKRLPPIPSHVSLVRAHKPADVYAEQRDTQPFPPVHFSNGFTGSIATISHSDAVSNVNQAGEILAIPGGGNGDASNPSPSTTVSTGASSVAKVLLGPRSQIRVGELAQFETGQFTSMVCLVKFHISYRPESLEETGEASPKLHFF